jgi:predicted outer membrane repeat protein
VTDESLCGDSGIYGGRGGAILTAEYGLIYDSTFSDNSAVFGGGAIFSLALLLAPTSDPYGVIDGSQFSNNTILDVFANEYSEGGNAVFQLNDELRISGSSFTSNTGPGSAVMVAGIAVVEDSVFARNTGTYGGAIGAESVLVSGSTFTGNSATISGGAITGQDVLITHSSFAGNSALRGGAVFYCAQSTISNSLFTRNVAESLRSIQISAGVGGAIAGYGNALALTTNRFTGNRAGVAGGAVWLEQYGAESLALMSGNRFTRNRAGRSGGAVGYNTLSVAGSVPSRSELRAAQRHNRFSRNLGGRGAQFGGFGVLTLD